MRTLSFIIILFFASVSKGQVATTPISSLDSNELIHVTNIVKLDKPISYTVVKVKDMVVLTMAFKSRVEIQTLKDGFTIDLIEIDSDGVVTVYPQEFD